VIKDFFIPIKITGNRTINVLQLKNKQYFNLLKFIQNQDFNNLNDYFNFIIYDLIVDKNEYNNLNFIDKLIILLTLRSICIAPDIEFESKDTIKFSKKIDIYSIYKQLETIQLKDNISYNNIVVGFNIPKELYYSSFDEIIESCIEYLTIDNETIFFSELDNLAKKEYINNLPGIIFTEAKHFFNNLETLLNQYTLIKEDKNFKIEQINLSLFKNTGFGLLSSVFKDNLLNFYNLIYIFTNKIHASLSDYYELTPAESTLMLNLYIKEQEEIKKANENKSVPLGKNVAK
jgi:hypothetical protein